jgi:ABC-type sugar transport system permease subunit
MGQAAAATVILFGVIMVISLAQLTVLSHPVEY